MPFNPDDYLAKKQVETAGPATGQAKGFDPNAYLTTKGVQTLPNNGQPETPPPADSGYQPTMLGAAISGLGQGVSYNMADEALSTIDPNAKEVMKKDQQAYPLTHALGQLAGAIISPNPFGKLGALSKAGTAAKMAMGAARFAGETGLASLGGSEKDTISGRLSDVQQNLSSPLTIGLGALASLAPALPTVIKGASDIIVKDGRKAVALGKGIPEALGSPEGQQIVTRAVNQFEGDTIQAAKQGVKALGDRMDQIAAQNADTIVNSASPLKKTFDALSKMPDNELLPTDIAAKNKLLNFLKGQDEALGQVGGADKAPFQKIYDLKKQLGRMLFDPSEGSARAFNNSPEVKREGIALYNSLRKTLSSADTTNTFDDISKAFAGTYRTMDAADNLGSSLAQMGDKLNTTGGRKRDAIVEAFKSIPADYVAAMPDLTNQITKKMDDVITAYNISSRISGKSASKGSIVSDILNKIPVSSDSSRLGLLNRLGRESAGTASESLSNPNVTRGLRIINDTVNPQAGIKQGALQEIK